MRPVLTSSVTPPQQWFVADSVTTNGLEEYDRFWLQNDRTRAGLPIDAKSPCGFIEVADRASDQFAIARTGQEAGGQKISEFSVGGSLPRSTNGFPRNIWRDLSWRLSRGSI